MPATPLPALPAVAPAEPAVPVVPAAPAAPAVPLPPEPAAPEPAAPADPAIAFSPCAENELLHAIGNASNTPTDVRLNHAFNGRVMQRPVSLSVQIKMNL